MVPRIMQSDHPFDQCFAETVLEGMHGKDPSQPPPPATEVFVDSHF